MFICDCFYIFITSPGLGLYTDHLRSPTQSKLNGCAYAFITHTILGSELPGMCGQIGM